MNHSFAKRYILQSELGRGNFGTVYRAVDTQPGNHPVAIKVLHPQLIVAPDIALLLKKEADILARLRHDHIVTIYDRGMWQGQYYFTMELIEGPTLAQLLEQEGAQPAARVIPWLLQASAALTYAHNQQVLHGDLKLSNLLLNQKRTRLFVADFGLAQVVGGSVNSASQQMAQLTGTAAYRAPEVVQTGHTPASDFYSLGVVAYELVAGKRPFLADDPLTLMQRHKEWPVPPLPANCPPDLADVIYHLLEKNPTERFANAYHVERAFGRVPDALNLKPPAENTLPDPGKATEQSNRKKSRLRLEPNTTPEQPMISPPIFLFGMAILLVIVILLYLAVSAGLTS